MVPTGIEVETRMATEARLVDIIPGMVRTDHGETMETKTRTITRDRVKARTGGGRIVGPGLESPLLVTTAEQPDTDSRIVDLVTKLPLDVKRSDL